MVPVRQTPLTPKERAARVDALPRKVIGIGNLIDNLRNIAGEGPGRDARLAFTRSLLVTAIGTYIRVINSELGRSFLLGVQSNDQAALVQASGAPDITATLDRYVGRNGWRAPALHEIVKHNIPANLVAEAAESVAFTFSVDRFVGQASRPGTGGVMNEISSRNEMQKQVLGPFWHDDVSDWLEKLAEEQA